MVMRKLKRRRIDDNGGKRERESGGAESEKVIQIVCVGAALLTPPLSFSIVLGFYFLFCFLNVFLFLEIFFLKCYIFNFSTI